MNPIYATWCISNNIGDLLTPWLIEKITGQTPLYVPYEVCFPKYMVSGSILNHACKYTTVWGAGIASHKDNIDSNIDCISVRGPLTARIVRLQTGIPVEIVGDSAWLMPRFYAPEICDKRYKAGIVPHYLHQAEVSEWIGDRNIKLINVFDAPEKFVKDLCNCDVIYSSSLHGLVIADAYGVPSRWIECTAKLGGDGMKFYDHLIVRDCLCDTNMPVLDKLKLFVKYNESHIAVPELNEPIKPIHIQQLPREAEALMDAIIDMPVPKPEARKELCVEIMSVCPFSKDDPKANKE